LFPDIYISGNKIQREDLRELKGIPSGSGKRRRGSPKNLHALPIAFFPPILEAFDRSVGSGLLRRLAHYPLSPLPPFVLLALARGKHVLCGCDNDYASAEELVLRYWVCGSQRRSMSNPSALNEEATGFFYFGIFILVYRVVGVHVVIRIIILKLLTRIVEFVIKVKEPIVPDVGRQRLSFGHRRRRPTQARQILLFEIKKKVRKKKCRHGKCKEERRKEISRFGREPLPP